MNHVITALVENQPGVLARVVGLISGRGFNIDSLNVAPQPDATASLMTIQVLGDDRVLEQVTKQLNKLVDVVKVSDLTTKSFIEREVVMLKVAVPTAKRGELRDLVAITGAEIVAVQAKSVVVSMVGDRKKLAEFVELLKQFTILEMSRSGVIAVSSDEADRETTKRKTSPSKRGGMTK
ncbi:MAG: acetolactate synthase small subunit [Lentisphaerales bacterium]|nr:MAG: acetolactate synthase small subunit [Lentisphaerales bacterium]